MLRDRFLAAACFALGPVCATGARVPLDIKPGLWEITLTVRSSGLPPSPGARDRGAAGPRTTVKRSCLDESELHRPLTFAFGSESQGCRQTIVNASPRAQEIRVDCGHGTAHGGGSIQIEARDAAHVKVSSRWFAADRAGGSPTIQMSSMATLQWIGTVCEADFPAAQKTIAPPAPVPPAAPKSRPAPVAPPAAPRSAPPPAPHQAAPVVSGTADAATYEKLGREQAGRDEFQKALQSLNRAIALDSERATAFNARGYVYLRLKDFVTAMADFSAAIRLRPDYANAYRNRAMVRRRLGDAQGAAADTMRAASLANGR